jgi:hypothetical protein
MESRTTQESRINVPGEFSQQKTKIVAKKFHQTLVQLKKHQWKYTTNNTVSHNKKKGGGKKKPLPHTLSPRFHPPHTLSISTSTIQQRQGCCKRFLQENESPNESP